ncbi:MAG: hypothetical protein AAF497_06840, partial [Planctomycetota bacterium]
MGIPFLEKLEDRILLTAEPSVTVEGPASVELGQQNVGYTLTFDNASGDDTPNDPNDGDVGYLPFIDVVLPTTGVDGDDGVSFDSATFLGQPIAVQQIVFDANGEAEHPLAVDGNGNPLVISGMPGDTLVVIELPYGSFSPNQAPVEIELVLDFSPLADLDETLTIETLGGFALGSDPLDNPDVDPSIRVPADTVTTDVTPTLITLTKENTGEEGDTVSGPNYPRTWTITLDVADGQTLTDVQINDLVPTNIHYLGNLQVNGAAGFTILDQPTVDAVVAAGDQDIVIDIPTVTGGSPISVSFDYFIPEFDSFGNPVIDPTSGNESLAVNDVSAAGDWTPLDPRDDPVRIVSDDVVQDDVITLRSIAVQKSFVISDDQNVAGPTPGDTLTYSLDVDISDFFTIGDIVLEDTLSDGLIFAGNAMVVVTEENGDSIALSAFPAAALTVFNNTPGTGQTSLEFDLSAAMQALGAADGILVGDLVDGVQEGRTTATITYDATIADQFADPVDQAEVSQGDDLSNDVTVTGSVRDNVDPTIVTGTEDDTSSAGFTIPFGGIESKEVIAINGVAPSADLLIAPGDIVTFSVSYTAPIGSFEDLTLDDFLPLPVFDANEVTSFDLSAPSAANPAAGTASFGAGTSLDFFNNRTSDPTISTNTTSNSVTFEFGDFSLDPRDEVTIEILFSVSVVDAVFADGLLLTNQATTSEENTGDQPVTTTTITQFVFGQPELEVTKGVIATTQGSLSATAGPFAFTDPGTSGQRWPAGSIINSTNLDATPIDANLTGVDAGDLVSFAIVVENTGSAPNGAFNVQVQDTLPSGFTIPPGGLNIDVRDGAGNVIAFTDLGGGLFGNGIELVDGPIEGAISNFDAADGSNVAIVTYDLIVDNSAEPRETFDNVASIENFSAFESGDNRVPADGLEDDASVSTLRPDIDKQIKTTSIGDDTSTNVLIGEVITYEIVMEFNEGTTGDVVFIDRTRFVGGGNDPDPGALEILDAEITSIGSNLTLQNAFAVGDGPSTASFDTNSDGVNDRLEF